NSFMWPRSSGRVNRPEPYYDGGGMTGGMTGILRRMRGFLAGWGMSWHGFLAMFTKEFIQMRRDRMTFGMMVGMPLMQLFLFGFAINTDPRELPTVLVAADNGPATRAVVSALENTGYYRFTHRAASAEAGGQLVHEGTVQFAVIFPEDFERRY